MLWRQRSLFLQNVRCGLLPFNCLTPMLSVASGYLPKSVMLGKLQLDSKLDLADRVFSQIPDIDYHETFSPRLRIMPLCLLLTISTYVNLETTFFHGYLEENIYMEQPKMVGSYPNYVSKLRMPLYGLKHSPRQWYSMLQSSC